MPSQIEYTMEELIEETGVTARTIRNWIRSGLLEAPPFRGPATTYSAEHLARLRAIRMLRSRNMGLRAIKKHLAKATPAEIERMIAPPSPEIGERPPPPSPAYPAEQWERIILAPGLEIHVRADAGALLRRVADDIHRHYGSAQK